MGILFFVIGVFLILWILRVSNKLYSYLKIKYPEEWHKLHYVKILSAEFFVFNWLFSFRNTSLIKELRFRDSFFKKQYNKIIFLILSIFFSILLLAFFLLLFGVRE